jgi:hypothetical protein
VEHFKHLGTTLTDQNYVREEFKSTVKSASACYRLVQNLVCSTLPSKNLKFKIRITVILSVVVYGFETWSPILREEHRLRVFENRVLKEILWLRGTR